MGLAHEVAIFQFCSGAVLTAQKTGHGGRARIGCGFKWRSRDLGLVPKAIIQNLSSASRLAHPSILPGVRDFGRNESNALARPSLFGADYGREGLGSVALLR